MKDEQEQTSGASWWHEMLTRREAGKRIAAIGATAAVVAGATSIVGCGDGEEEAEAAVVERDALDIQKEVGWNAGAEKKPLTYRGRANTDSQGTLDWNNYLQPAPLLAAWQPKDSTLQPYVVPTLVQSLEQKSLKGEINPVHTKAMDEAYSRGLGMKEILAKSKAPEGTMLVVDLPGPEAVAYAAALADVVDPVITFDNWPHPNGVVPSHETLGAMLYYADEVKAKSASRPADAPALVVLDANRLNTYTDDETQFDNRYVAKVPTADRLASMKVTNVLYAVPSSSMQTERDDLNDDFATYKEKGINIAMVPLSEFTPAEGGNAVAAADSARSGNGSTVHRTYYYGGGAMFAPWFFYHYPVFYSSSIPSRSALPSTSVRPHSYTPTRRPTMFSSRSTGGASGVGRTRPTGFGRVSTRTSSSGRTVVGGASGRSGSYGRSSGRGYSG